MATSHPSPTDGPETGFSDGGEEESPRARGESKRKRFHPLRAVRNIFRRAKRHGPEEETGASKKSRSTSELSSVQTLPDTPTFPGLVPPYAAGLSVSHDSIFSPDQQLAATLDSSEQQVASSRSMQHVRLKGFKEELFSRVRVLRDSDDEDAGLPLSPCTSPTTAEILAQGLHDKPSHSRSTCSAGSLVSMGSSECDEDSGGFMSSSHSSRMSLLDRRFENDGEPEIGQSVPLNHNAARHKMSVRPKRTHGLPRHRKMQQMAAAAGVGSLPSTPEVTEDMSLASIKHPPNEPRDEPQASNQSESLQVGSEPIEIQQPISELGNNMLETRDIPIEESIPISPIIAESKVGEEKMVDAKQLEEKLLLELASPSVSPPATPTKPTSPVHTTPIKPVSPIQASTPKVDTKEVLQVSPEQSQRVPSPDKLPVKVKGKSNAAELKLRHEIKQYSKRQKELATTNTTPPPLQEGTFETIQVKDCLVAAAAAEEVSVQLPEVPIAEATSSEERFKSTIVINSNSDEHKDIKKSSKSVSEMRKSADNLPAESVGLTQESQVNKASDPTNRLSNQDNQHNGLTFETNYILKQASSKGHENLSEPPSSSKDMQQSGSNRIETGMERSLNIKQPTDNKKSQQTNDITTNNVEKSNKIDETKKEIDSKVQDESKKPDSVPTTPQKEPTPSFSNDFDGIMKQRRTMTESELPKSTNLERTLSEDVSTTPNLTNKRFSVEIVPFNTRNKDPNYLPTSTPVKNSEDAPPLESITKEPEAKPEAEYPPVELRRKHSFTTTSKVESSSKDTEESSASLSTGSQIKYPVQFRIRRGKSLNEKCGAGHVPGKEATPEKSQIPRPKSQILLKEDSSSSSKGSTVPEFMKIQLRSSREELDRDPPRSSPPPANAPQWEVKIGQSKSQVTPTNGTSQAMVTPAETKPSETHSVNKLTAKEAEIKDRKDSENKENIGSSNVLVKDDSEIGLVTDQSGDEGGRISRSITPKDDGRRKSQSFTVGSTGTGIEPEPELFRVFARRSIKQRNSSKPSKSTEEEKKPVEAPVVVSPTPVPPKEETPAVNPAYRFERTPWKPHKSETKSPDPKPKDPVVEKKPDAKSYSEPTAVNKPTPKPLESKMDIKINLDRTRFSKVSSTEPDNQIRRKSSGAADIPTRKNSTAADTPARKNSTAADIPARKNTTAADIPARKNSTAVDVPVRKNSTAADIPVRKPSVAVDIPFRKSSVAADVSNQSPDQKQASQSISKSNPSIAKSIEQPISKPAQQQQTPIAKTSRVTVSIKPQTEPQLQQPQRKSSLPDSPNLAKNGQQEMDPFGSNNNHIPGTPTWMQLAQQRREQREQKERMMYGSQANAFVLDTSGGSKPSRNSKVLDLVNNFQKLQTT